jgi:hypothetical protein
MGCECRGGGLVTQRLGLVLISPARAKVLDGGQQSPFQALLRESPRSEGPTLSLGAQP